MRKGLTRRQALSLAGAAAASASLAPFAWAAGRSGLHGLAIFGDLKYPAGFTHFEYLNPAAPKGGRMNFQPPNWANNQSPTTFNTLNGFVLKGDAPPRIEMTFDTLMTRATDEPDAIYGLVAESVDVSDDLLTWMFHLSSAARFHDGSPLTADDAAFSLMLLKDKGHPSIAEPLRQMAAADAIDATTLKVTLTPDHTRQTILSVAGDCPIFSKAYYSAHPFDSSSLDAPLGSGPYRVGNLAPGRFIEYERVADYWGKDLAVNAGANNFDIIRIDFFTERQTAFEAFKKGDITFREEFTAITWAQGYDFPAITAGKVKKTTEFSAERLPSFQGFYINARRPQFADPRTRLAIGLAFDFEWSNANLFFGSYTRGASLFGISDFAASGPPSGAELAILEPFRATLPAEVFAAPYVPPKTDGSGRDRAMLRHAFELLTAAGFTQQGGQLVAKDGTALTLEFLIDQQIFERVLTPYIANLKALGIAATIRQADPAQYQARQDAFDFDVIMSAFQLPATPIDGLQQFYSSRAADQQGSRNYAGMKEPAIDAALAKMPAVKTRDDLIAITRVIDRVARAKQYVIPAWYLAAHRTAYWDVFGHPTLKPDYAFNPEATWWFDRDRASAIGYTG
jgi:microcin C transport system substrate-binding protein